MLTANNTIFSSQAAQQGVWRNIQNWMNFSLQVDGIEGNVWVEVSNDPNVLTNGAHISAPAAPVLTQYTPTADSHLKGVPVDTTYYVENTYVTPTTLNPTGGAPQYTTVGTGETLASTESSLLVTAGNLLAVQSPAQDAGKVAVGWNTYISTTSGAERLQNLEDNVIVAPHQFGQSFILSNWGLSTAGRVVPVSDTSATAASGINLTGNLATVTTASYPNPAASGTGINQIQIFVSGGSAMINPSGIIWNFIRVCKDNSGNTKTTNAFLFGQTA